MAHHPRGLSVEEAALWEKLASSVTPLEPNRQEALKQERNQERNQERGPLLPRPTKTPVGTPRKQPKGRVPKPLVSKPPAHVPAHQGASEKGLDSHWERRLSRASTEPDFTLDLHGHTLDQAHRRLDIGIGQAKAMDARLVLLITGKPRPVDAADRGTKRGAIRAKILDWLAAGPHGSDIAAIRKAHRRHGGEGALYLVLKRRR